MRFETRYLISDLHWIDTAERRIAAAKASLEANPDDGRLECLVLDAERALELQRDRMAWRMASMNSPASISSLKA